MRQLWPSGQGRAAEQGLGWLSGGSPPHTSVGVLDVSEQQTAELNMELRVHRKPLGQVLKTDDSQFYYISFSQSDTKGIHFLAADNCVFYSTT